MRILLVAISLWFLTLQAEAATYYVTKTGSDARSCPGATNPATPKQTLSGVAGGISCLTPGDTLEIGAGTYAEALDDTIPSGLSPSAPTIIKSAAGATVIINGNANGSVIRIWDKSYITLDRLTLDSQNINGINGLGTLRADYITLQNSIIKNGFETDSCVEVTGNNVTIINNTVFNCNGPTHTAGTHGIYIGAGTGYVVSHNEVYSISDYGIQQYHYPSDAQISYNFIHGAKDGIIATCGTGTAVWGNIIANGTGNGIILNDGAVNTLVYNNTIYNNAGYAMSLATGSCNAGPSGVSGAVIKNNLSVVNGNNSIQDLGSGTSAGASNLFRTDTSTIFTGTPSTTNPIATQFQLGASSAAKNNVNAVNLPQPYNVDYAGIARTLGAFDIGAYEAVAGGGPPILTINLPAGCVGTTTACTTTSATVSLSGTATAQ